MLTPTLVRFITVQSYHLVYSSKTTFKCILPPIEKHSYRILMKADIREVPHHRLYFLDADLMFRAPKGWLLSSQNGGCTERRCSLNCPECLHHYFVRLWRQPVKCPAMSPVRGSRGLSLSLWHRHALPHLISFNCMLSCRHRRKLNIKQKVCFSLPLCPAPPHPPTQFSLFLTHTRPVYITPFPPCIFCFFPPFSSPWRGWWDMLCLYRRMVFSSSLILCNVFLKKRTAIKYESVWSLFWNICCPCPPDWGEKNRTRAERDWWHTPLQEGERRGERRHQGSGWERAWKESTEAYLIPQPTQEGFPFL